MKNTKTASLKTNKFIKALKIATFIVVGLMVFAGLTLSLYLINLNNSLKFNQEDLMLINTQFNIYDSNNDELSRTDNQKSKVKLDELPSYVPASFISIEDKKFYSHHGINPKRILKAMYRNLKSGKMSEGASTISQQLIKNTHLSTEKTYERKIKEMLLTLKMEKSMSKNEILETYLNAIYFGNGAYGLDNASKVYFNKSAKDLTVSESATLAGIIKSPKAYSPIYNYDNCLKRRNLVLKEMLKDNVISLDEYNKAVNEEIVVNKTTLSKQNFYEQAVIDEATKVLDLSEKELATKGYYIFTYLDKKAQESLTSAVNNSDYYHQNEYGNVADSCGIVIDNETGGIIAFNGKSNFDLVNMHRSPGSSIKPILVYAPALEKGVISPVSPILDEKTNFGGYTPQNVGDKYYGYVSATESVEKSLNVPAIKILQATGMQYSKNIAEKSGIEFDRNDKNYAIALGGMTKGTTVKQLVNSYLPFSNNGNFKEAKFIKKICDKNGNVIYANSQSERSVIGEESAYLMTQMLISGVKKGTSSRLSTLNYQVAGKTGTVGIKNTNLNSDVWSVAYTSENTFGIWLGNSTGDKNYMLEGCNNGGTYCTSMLKNCMENVYKNHTPSDFKTPKNIEQVELDSQELENNHALLLADANTPEIFKVKAIFNKKYVPTRVAKSFSELKAINVSVTMKNNVPTLSFTALPQVEYKIYRINDDECKVIETIKNKKGLIIVDDDSVLDGEFYTYYVEAVATNHATKTHSKRIRSNSVKVFTNMSS